MRQKGVSHFLVLPISEIKLAFCEAELFLDHRWASSKHRDAPGFWDMPVLRDTPEIWIIAYVSSEF